MSYSQSEIADLENVLDFNKPISSRVVPRWQRKAALAQGTPGKHRSGSADAPRSATKVRCATCARCTRGCVRCAHAAAGCAAQSDRFIPNRAAMDMDVSSFRLMRDGEAAATSSEASGAAEAAGVEGEFAEALAASVGCGGGAGADHRVLAFRNKAPAPAEGYQSSLKVLYSQARAKAARPVRCTRHIPTAPDRILDAPDMVDDYYLNLLDWSRRNVLAVALGPTVYLWNKESGGIEELMQCEGEDDYVCSVSWIGDGSHLAIGTSRADVQLWDATSLRQVRSLRGHEARVGALSWNQHILSSGSRDASIINHDVRVAQHRVDTLRAHEQEVCGLRWSPDGATLASGGNDNLLCLWDARGSSMSGEAGAPRATLADHTAAVKALAWCPFQRNVLASGGGTADRCIKLWNAGNGACLNSIDTGSQVCSLLWSPHEKELLSSHGFSQNQLCLWSYPAMAKVKELTGHTARVLHMAVSPDGTSVCSAGADETLRFWSVFGEARKEAKRAGSSGRLMTGMNLR